MSARRVLLICQDFLGSRMAGPAIRCANLARELGKRYEVTLLSAQPVSPDFSIDGVEIVATEPRFSFMAKYARGFDVVVTQPLRMHVQHALVRADVPVIYDLYVPSLVEMVSNQASETSLKPRRRRLNTRRNHLDAVSALSLGDAFICANEAQRDFWLGALGALGRLDIDTYAADPTGQALIATVPFGLPPKPPVHDAPALRGVIEGIGHGDFVMLWAGGLWNWLDPLTVIDAVGRLRERHPQVRLCFMGKAHPNPDMRMGMMDWAVERAESQGLRGSHVFFAEEWVPYDERHNYLLEADVGVSAHHESLETRFAFRTRFLDHIWAGLPTLTTRGGSLSDLVEKRQLGLTVDHSDVQGWVAAVDRLIENPAELQDMREKTLRARDELTWPIVAEKLGALIEKTLSDEPPGRNQRTVRRLMPEYVWVQSNLQGPLRTGRKLVRTLMS